MLSFIRHRLLLRLQLREAWGVFFVLGVILLSFPFLTIFNTPRSILGIPLMYVYLFIGWLFSIGVIYLFATTIGMNDSTPPESGKT